MPKILFWLVALGLALALLSLTACGAPPTATPTPVKSVGDLPLPNGLTRLDFGLDDLKKINGLGEGLDLSGVEVGGYLSGLSTTDLLGFYQTKLPATGWASDSGRSQTNLLYFNKAGRITSVIALAVPNQNAAETLGNVVPAFKGKLKAGDNLLILAQGPQTAFTSSQN